MNSFGRRAVLAAAYEWKREREMELRLRLEIEAVLLRSLRTELAELRQLEGAELAHRFASETPADLARTMRGKRTWLEGLKWLWIGQRHPPNMAKAA